MGSLHLCRQAICVVCIVFVFTSAIPLQVGVEASLSAIDGQPCDTFESASRTLPPAVMRAAMAYDNESDRLVLYGGEYESMLSNQTWSYDFNSNQWTSITPAVSPPPLSYHQLVYDSESDLVVLFGGITVNSEMDSVWNNETWTYDLNSNTWTQMSSTPFADSYCTIFGVRFGTGSHCCLLRT